MIPFFIYYSMFGFQRIGDLLWAAGDMRCRGFVLGGTAGRTTLAGEGLQHQDGNSHLNALAYPNCQAYDPCYAYEMAVIVLDGMRRMYYEEEDVFYYITLMNENYEMPILPLGSTEGICRGIYRLSERRLGAEAAAGATVGQRGHPARIAAGPGNAGTTVRRRQQRLQRDQLQGPLLRRPRVRPLEPPAPRRAAAAAVCPAGAWRGDRARSWRPRITSAPWRCRSRRGSARDYTVLGTDGFGRSEARKELRRFFEVDAENIVLAALTQLAAKSQFPKEKLAAAIQTLGLDPEKADRVIATASKESLCRARFRVKNQWSYELNREH